MGGQPITYDALGNPLNYLGHNLTWDRVRQLEKFDNNTFDYNAFGKRSRKNSVYYLYDGDKLIKERRNGTSLVYFYDTTGICGFKYDIFTGGVNSTDYYFYRKNLQGDVTAILDPSGNVVAEYLYDAWGKCYITYDPTGIGEINPIRYRSYYFDTETGLYYLNSRYYDPNTGRFINADSIQVLSMSPMDLTDKNLYAYCDNNPVVRSDCDGKLWVVATCLIKVAIGLTTQYVGDVIGNVISGKSGWGILKPTSSISDYVSAGVTSLIPGSGVVSAVARSATTVAITNVEKQIRNKEVDLITSVIDVAVGTAVDIAVSSVNDAIDDMIDSTGAANYSSYAGQQRKKKPNITSAEIRMGLRNQVKMKTAIKTIKTVLVELSRTLLPY